MLRELCPEEKNFAYPAACGEFPSGKRLMPELNLDGCKGGILSGEAGFSQSGPVVLRVTLRGALLKGAKPAGVLGGCKVEVGCGSSEAV